MPFNNLLDAVLKKLLFYVFPYTSQYLLYKRYLVAVGGEKLLNKR